MIYPITEIPIPCTFYFCILFASILIVSTFDFIVNVTIDKLLISCTASLGVGEGKECNGPAQSYEFTKVACYYIRRDSNQLWHSYYYYSILVYYVARTFNESFRGHVPSLDSRVRHS